jgi:UDP-N-acetylmuramoyl-L-alanyl-D-glutamate--2,6-diaminopimelate ligase
MEVSSHAIVQERIEGIDFALKILTNIKSDHLDFHKTEEEYIRVKNSFFADESMKLVNRDEEKVEFNYKNAFSYAVEGGASFKILAYSLTKGLSGMIQHFDEVEDFHSPLYGLFNLYNITAAISAVKLLTKKPFSEINAVVNNFAGVSGRMEVVSQDPLVIVDFAHTHDGMYEVLNSLREKDILVVFGAGGDRDKQKRPLMGKVAASLAKRLYITSDNPRFEEPEAIIEDILEGIDDKSNVYVNVNRKEAIAKALEDRQGDEVVIILGKGDETTQTIYDKQVPFDDREVVRELFNIN